MMERFLERISLSEYKDKSKVVEVIKMKEYQHLIGKIIIAVAIIVAAIIIAQAIGGAGESIRSGLFQLGDALR